MQRKKGSDAFLVAGLLLLLCVGGEGGMTERTSLVGMRLTFSLIVDEVW